MTVSEGTDSILTLADLSTVSPQKVKIAEVILTADAPNIQFAGLSQQYRDLEIVTEMRSARTGGNSDGLRWQANGNSSATAYETQELNASGTTIAANRFTLSSGFGGEIVTSDAPAGRYSVGQMFLGNYSDSGKWTPYTNLASTSIASVGPWAFVHSGYFNINAAVTSLNFFTSTGNNFAAGSRITIYGANPINPTGQVPVDLATVRALRPYVRDGIDLSYTPGVGGTINGAAGASSLTVNALRAFVSDIRVTLPQTTLVYPARPATGIRLDVLVLRIDNANGGPSNPQLAIKTGTTANYPTLAQGDIYNDPTAVYEIALYSVNMPVSGAPTTFDVRPISRGLDGSDGAMVKLDEVTLGGDSAQLLFNNIPQSFKDLKVISHVKMSSGATASTFAMRLNQSTAYSYDNQVVQGKVNVPGAGETNDQNFAYLGDAAAYSGDSRIWHSVHETTIGMYSKANLFKTIMSVVAGGADNNTLVQVAESLALADPAVTSLSMFLTGGNMRVDTTIAIYGIR